MERRFPTKYIKARLLCEIDVVQGAQPIYADNNTKGICGIFDIVKIRKPFELS
jgi:hypothetical protein